MENEASGLTDSFVARHTTDPNLRLELLSRNQNGSRYDQGTGMGAEVRNIEYSIAFCCFFAVATAPLRCFAISLQKKYYQFSFT